MRILDHTLQKMQSIMPEKKPELDTLNPDQREKFDELPLFEPMRNRFQSPPPFRPGIADHGPEEMGVQRRAAPQALTCYRAFPQ